MLRICTKIRLFRTIHQLNNFSWEGHFRQKKKEKKCWRYVWKSGFSGRFINCIIFLERIISEKKKKKKMLRICMKIRLFRTSLFRWGWYWMVIDNSPLNAPWIKRELKHLFTLVPEIAFDYENVSISFFTHIKKMAKHVR
jgi:hypothetical protein